MSKIGQATITIPSGVQVNLKEGSEVSITGPMGTLVYPIPHGITIQLENSVLSVKRINDVKSMKALHGMVPSIIANAVSGVVKPWQKTLEVVGTGFNAKLEGKSLALKIGYSHIVHIPSVEGLTYLVEGNNKITVKGIDKQKVGEIAYKIRMSKKPDPYKGKGIRYDGEVVRLKAGKKAKTTTA